MNQNGSMMLVRKDGTVLATAPFNNDLIGKSLANYKLWDKFIKKEDSNQNIYETSEFDGINRYITCSKVPDFEFYVISTCIKNSVLEPWTQTIKLNIIFGILLIIIFIVLALIMHKMLTKLDNVMHDITNISNNDHLTGLYNRRFFSEQLEQEILRTERYGSKFTLVEMDIDKFKLVNDTLGHEAGDWVLKTLSNILKENIRKSDVIARWGGEEFVLMLTNTDLEQSVFILEKLRSIIETTDFKTVGHITCSFGVAEYRTGENFEKLLSRADQLLYMSKNNGRNRVTSDRQLQETDTDS
jgi:diguanylate cyclase (GGDEF)-like protein